MVWCPVCQRLWRKVLGAIWFDEEVCDDCGAD
jgi:hypothetical protein